MDAEQRDTSQGSGSASWLGPDLTVWNPPELRQDWYCPRGDLYPLSAEQKQDTSSVSEEDFIFVVASTRDPWANTTEGKDVDISDESPVSYYEEDNDAMSEGSSECPGE